jgi:hypothetical protein
MKEGEDRREKGGRRQEGEDIRLCILGPPSPLPPASSLVYTESYNCDNGHDYKGCKYFSKALFSLKICTPLIFHPSVSYHTSISNLPPSYLFLCDA